MAPHIGHFPYWQPFGEIVECKSIPDAWVAALSRLADERHVAEHIALDALDALEDKALAIGHNSQRKMAKMMRPEQDKIERNEWEYYEYQSQQLQALMEQGGRARQQLEEKHSV